MIDDSSRTTTTSIGFASPFKRSAVEEVQAIWHTTGEEDFILKVLVTDMAQYEEFAVHHLSAVPNIGRVRTSFCLSTIKDDSRVALDLPCCKASDALAKSSCRTA